MARVIFPKRLTEWFRRHRANSEQSKPTRAPSQRRERKQYQLGDLRHGGAQVREFFAFARERYRIFLHRKAGHPQPWTTDPVLLKYRFCNIFREDDRTTQWFRAKVRQPLRDDPAVLMATIIFRWFNRITTGEVLLQNGLLTDWNPSRARSVLKDLQPLITGAYVIRTPGGMNKLEGLIKLIDPLWKERDQLYVSLCEAGTLSGAGAILQNRDGLGSFMAYEIVTDLRHTHVLEKAEDIMTWANPGPGASKGLGLVLLGDENEFKYDAAIDAVRLQEGMQHLLALAGREEHWPSDWPRWEMREVEHTLCEYSKYCGAKAGRKLKQRFQPR